MALPSRKDIGHVGKNYSEENFELRSKVLSELLPLRN